MNDTNTDTKPGVTQGLQQHIARELVDRHHPDGKAELRAVIHRHRARAERLQVIYDMLPENPSEEQHTAIWQMALELK